MLTTAGITSAIFAVGVLTGALIVSAWGFLDLLPRSITRLQGRPRV